MGIFDFLKKDQKPKAPKLTADELAAYKKIMANFGTNSFESRKADAGKSQEELVTRDAMLFLMYPDFCKSVGKELPPEYESLRAKLFPGK